MIVSSLFFEVSELEKAVRMKHFVIKLTIDLLPRKTKATILSQLSENLHSEIVALKSPCHKLE